MIEINNIKKIVTHSGVFHADEVFAIALLQILHKMLDDNYNIEVIRTRDSDVIAAAKLDWNTVVLDVGGEYDQTRGLFDHHQIGFSEVDVVGFPRSTAGLIALQYCVDFQYDSIYRLMDEIDIVDNGKNLIDYPISLLRLSQLNENWNFIISQFNPTWKSEEDENIQFNIAVEFATSVLNFLLGLEKSVESTIIDLAKARIELHKQHRNDAVNYVKEIATRSNILMVMDKFAPWQDVVVENYLEILFVIFPDKSGEWIISAVPRSLKSFGNRKDLPEEWAGLSGQELVTINHIDGSTFCHKGRFIAGNKSKEGILLMAHLALRGVSTFTD